MSILNKKDLKYIKSEEKKDLTLFNSNSTYSSNIIKEYFEETNRSVIVVCSDLFEAHKYLRIFEHLFDKQRVLFYPSDQSVSKIMSLRSPEFKNIRLNTISNLLEGVEAKVVVTNYEGLELEQIPPSTYKNERLKLKINDTINRQDIIQKLINLGYVQEYIVEKPGDFTIRGGVIDFYSVENKNPIRIDFFGNTIDSIKFFDVNSQRSIKKINQVVIGPVNEIFYSEEIKNNIINKIENALYKNEKHLEEIKKTIELDLKSIQDRENLDALTPYISLISNKKYTILDFISNFKLFFINLSSNIKKVRKIDLDIKNDKITFIENISKKNETAFKFQKYINIEDYSLIGKNAHDLKIYKCNNYLENLELLYEDIKNYDIQTINLYYNKYLDADKFKNRLKEKFNKITIKKLTKKIFDNFINSKSKTLYIDLDSFLSKTKRKNENYRSAIRYTTKVSTVNELKNGDFVVHYDFGIGKYLGLETLSLGKIKNDYLKIEYQNQENLFIPINQINKILRYDNRVDFIPKLTRLGSKNWSRTKAKVKMKIKEYQDALIKIYKEKENSEGFVFTKDVELEKMFRDDFQYKETVDQSKAIKETLEDMESKRPMDRLICGDVGFGKTEVALRATFRAAINGKKVILLAPTTILSKQHFNTFQERLSKYDIRVGLLNRFVNKKKIIKTVNDFNHNKVQILIGTHMIISKIKETSGLGLLIIDEEQRFGVIQKERIRGLKANVDILSMSATPIPRTLQMSLTGIKKISTINTPPKNRYPIQTYVLKRNYDLVKEILEKELSRKGQVFYLFNQISGMEQIFEIISNLNKNAKVCMLHGRMNDKAIEEIMIDFIDHKYDIMISTTIIENGIDIPNSNTIIVHDALKLGLAQLYQIRGRVGRSDKIAYAYMLYDNKANIREDAKKRLFAIKDFSSLGSGYKLAIRDLSIRGAGDLLGREQSGYIDSVGYEMYSKLVKEVIEGNEGKNISENVVEFSTQRYIDPAYIPYDEIRIEIHKRINALENKKDIIDLLNEMTDRFGQPKEEIYTYMIETVLNKLKEKLNAKKMIVEKSEYIFDIENQDTIKKFIVNKDLIGGIDIQILMEKSSMKVFLQKDNKDEKKQFKLIEELEKLIDITK